MTAKEFIESLDIIQQDYADNLPKREIFALAKVFQKMEVTEVVKLLKNKNEDYRLGAVSILDWKARNKKTSNQERKEIYEAYLNNHTWIDNWGLVDRAAPYVIGGFLADKSREPLYILAQSKNPMERRTAIVSTYFFIRQNDIDDTFKIAEILVHDENEYVQKAVGSWIREAGKRDEEKLKKFLHKYAYSMPRIMLRYAIEKLEKDERKHYLELAKRIE